jgi:hypothetical protein
VCGGGGGEKWLGPYGTDTTGGGTNKKKEGCVRFRVTHACKGPETVFSLAPANAHLSSFHLSEAFVIQGKENEKTGIKPPGGDVKWDKSGKRFFAMRGHW